MINVSCYHYMILTIKKITLNEPKHFRTSKLNIIYHLLGNKYVIIYPLIYGIIITFSINFLNNLLISSYYVLILIRIVMII